MFGSKVRYGVTYKINQKSIDIWTREYQHNFVAPIVHDNLKGAIGFLLSKLNLFLVTHEDVVKFYDIDNYQEVKEMKLHIGLLETITRERNEIIGV